MGSDAGGGIVDEYCEAHALKHTDAHIKVHAHTQIARTLS